MEKQVRAALVGFGGMGQIYARMIYSGMVPELKLGGVCCRNEAGFTSTAMRKKWLRIRKITTR